MPWAFLTVDVDLQTVANDAGIAQETLQLAAIIASDALGIESVERCAIVLALLQDRVPTESSLRAFEDQELEENEVIVLGRSPILRRDNG